MKIVIPTYNRYNDFKTIKLLEGYEDITYIFVVQEEEQLYKDAIGDKFNIIVGELGLKNQRNFITNYFDEDEILICMDDDISWFNKPINEWIDQSIEYLSQSNLGMITFSSTTMYIKDKIKYTEGFYLGVGVLTIIKNHKEFQLNYNQCEDYERSILYLKKYGKNIRIHGVAFKTKYFGKGGLESYRTIDKYVNETNRLVYEYNDYLYFKDKVIMKHKLGNVNLYRKLKNLDVTQLGYYNCFDELYQMFESVKLTKRGVSNNRRDFPHYYGAIFGMVRPRFKYKGYDELSLDSKRFPHIYEEIMRIGKIICPFEFKSIQVNKNLVCPKHVDGNNRGLSLLVSFGEYTGCNIVVNDISYDANCRPVVFNGALHSHYNTDDLQGTKYSLVYFS
tara:strand:+ start:391 stop:1563 length:1173 start_codon:yes stop_codon:yes gene_type:complete